jgi:hypothetical protein
MIAKPLLTIVVGLAAVVATPVLATPEPDGPPFGRQTYYGELSQTAADRAAFAPLIKRFLGRPYDELRRNLIAMGFRPVRIHNGRSGDPCDRFTYSEIRHYPELLACAVSGGFAGKSFLYRRPHDRGYAIVTTYGEEHYRVNAVRAATKSDLEYIRDNTRLDAGERVYLKKRAPSRR